LAAASLAAPATPSPAAEPAAHEVWQMQNSGTTASLRGIVSVDGVIAWASGSQGTVLRTLDGGAHWLPCATPGGDQDGATLDFRGVQAWDADTAIVMASGPGDKSRLYKTTDGCKTWRLLLRNNDPAGFFDALAMWDREHGFLLGDPVQQTPYMSEEFSKPSGTKRTLVQRTLKAKRFLTLSTIDGGESWAYWGTDRGYFTEDAAKDGAAFAASNSSVFMPFQRLPYCWPSPPYAATRAWLGLGGKGGARILVGFSNLTDVCQPVQKKFDELRFAWSAAIPVPMASGSDSAGIFSLAFRIEPESASLSKEHINVGSAEYDKGIAVGGDYTKPGDASGTAAYSLDGGLHWSAAEQPPHGYRSTVQWSEAEKLWITAGTNGSDASADDGRTWQPLDNGNWNALALPFLVGPKGRIARLDLEALRQFARSAH
jgi:hypothetical protein